MITHSRPCLSEDDYREVLSTLRSGMLCGGEKSGKFKDDLKKYLRAETVIVCTSGKNALILSLLALNIGQEDEVILPTYVCKSVYEAVQSVGAVPVLCDISDRWIMEDQNVASKITSKTKAIIVVHIFGILTETQDFLKFGIPIIEDFCQAFGAQYHSNDFPILGDVAFFSFHATKCLTSIEGGAISTNRLDVGEFLMDKSKKYLYLTGMNDVQASLGIAQLRKYHNFLEKRREIASIYLKRLPRSITMNLWNVREKSLFFRFPVTSCRQNFRNISEGFLKEGICVKRGVDLLLHRQYGMPDSLFSKACECFNSTISLPIYPSLKNEEIEKIIDVANKYDW